MNASQQKKHYLTCKVTSAQHFGNGWFTLAFSAPEIAASARPGQFAQVRGWEGGEPLLGRPFGISGRTGNDIGLLIKIVGRGTELLSRKKPGDTLEAIGPLGNGFDIPQPDSAVWLAAGGTGLAPLLFFHEECRKSKTETHLFFGARNADECRPMEPLCKRNAKQESQIVLCTDDGGFGRKGFVTDAMAERLEAAGRKPDAIFACGPLPMMRRAHELAAQAGIPCFVSLEAHMGCGFGACMGCVVPGRGKPYYHVCSDGPVFSSSDIDWEKFIS